MLDLTNKTQAQADLEASNLRLRVTINYVAATIKALNNSRVHFWSFSDERLNAMFAEIGAVKLQEIFENHAASAALLNEVAERSGIPDRAEIGTMRDVEVVNGVFRVVPTPP